MQLHGLKILFLGNPPANSCTLSMILNTLHINLQLTVLSPHLSALIKMTVTAFNVCPHFCWFSLIHHPDRHTMHWDEIMLALKRECIHFLKNSMQHQFIMSKDPLHLFSSLVIFINLFLLTLLWPLDYKKWIERIFRHCRNCRCNPKMTSLTGPRWRTLSRGGSFMTRLLPSMEVEANLRKEKRKLQFMQESLKHSL